MLKHEPPTETDGICGALAVARAACLAGKSAVVLTDDCNARVVAAAVAATNGRLGGAAGGGITFESFPPAGACREGDLARLRAAGAAADVLVAVERVRVVSCSLPTRAPATSDRRARRAVAFSSAG